MAHILTDYGLVDLGCESSLRRSTVRPVSYLTTLGGVTKAQVGPRTGRTWDLSLPSTSTPDQYAALHALVEGEYGSGPWGFVSDAAKVSNMLTPQTSLLRGHAGTSSVTTGGPPLRLPDGSVSASTWVVAQNAAPMFPRTTEYEYLAVAEGKPFTASVWVADAPGVRLRVWLYDRNGTQVRSVQTSRSTGTLQRLTVSDVAQPGEVSALMIVDNLDAPFRMARPAFTWTHTVQPWALGEGAMRVLITEADLDTVSALPGGTYGKSSFVAREVG